MKAVGLKTGDLKNPLGIDLKQPRLSWNLESGIRQTAYRVIVQERDGKILFDSGRQETDSMHCSYEGEPLESRMQCVWKVAVWDENGEMTWSDPAEFEMGLLKKEDFCAKWIHGIDTDMEERLPADYYRKKYFVKGKVKKARLYVTARGVYAARVNGNKVSTFLAPGTTNYQKRLYYQTYDITDLLRNGAENECLFTVADGWYKGKLGADQNECLYGTQTALWAQLEIVYENDDRETICSDHTFEWTNDGPLRFSDLKDGEIYDARKKLNFSQYAQEEQELGIIPTASNAEPLREQEVFSATLEISPSGKKILDFGQNIAGFVKFRVNTKKDTEVVLRLFEAKDHGEYSNTSLSFSAGNVDCVKQEIRLIASGAEDVYEEAFFYSGFQYALVEGLDEIDPNDFKAVAAYSDLSYGGMFFCSNESLNQFVKNTIWSMKGNFVDIPTDCPQREKAGWTGDAQVFCKTANYFADTKAFYRKWFLDIKDCQREDGMVLDVNPRVSRPDPQRDTMNGSCGWADAAVIIPYTLWKMTGDRGVIEDAYEVMHKWKQYIIHACEDKTPLPIPGRTMLEDSEWKNYVPEGGLHWGEWCVPKSQEPPENDDITELLKSKPEITCAYAHYSMTLLAEMLVCIGKKEEAEECKKYADGTWNAYHYYWLKDKTVETNHMAELVRPIALGLADEEEKKNIAARLNEMVRNRNYKVGTGFLSTPFLLQTLAENGYVESAYRMLENEEAPGWLAMVRQGATTVWEEYECYDENQTPLQHSFNHYSPGAMCAFLFDSVCGIRFDGENHFRIKPLPGGTLTFAKAVTQTAYGKVESGWKLAGDETEYTISIPANTTADVKLPDGSTYQLTAGRFTVKSKR